MAGSDSLQFLTGLLGKTLHISILDGRRFTGQQYLLAPEVSTKPTAGSFKCTDRDTNIVLSNTFEYRKPSAKEEARLIEEAKIAGKPVKADMTSRFLGLVTIGRAQIVKIELEERRSDLSGPSSLPVRIKG